ncbi:DUF3870 domain-containing protein [Pseudogracilibacillus auburnensis]|uniref:Uncharacterized protein DUF3870 n=1 Tax=Pseudogracilibacillus auburnensis TaxID=1494959 RepID=A0A2V3W1U0_9BACI|nr:DUF3870 domain-containing protein [Pseudogracilibacillus auburnensis]MBO1002767.1 DUF3870 domain-containing protein [Pseudogracilibacillus auburnensis]PXW87880.1 uncharacterized protein DUF3870 [Pseudogracilibacillus auburnensis]
MEKLTSVLVTGYAKAPQGTSMYEIYRHAGIVLEIELKTHTIIDVEFTMVADLTKKFFKKLVVGYSLEDGLDGLISRIKQFYFAPSQQAIIVALQSANQRYWEYLNVD